jgi:hypothetical protein
MLAAVEVEEV